MAETEAPARAGAAPVVHLSIVIGRESRVSLQCSECGHLLFPPRGGVPRSRDIGEGRGWHGWVKRPSRARDGAHAHALTEHPDRTYEIETITVEEWSLRNRGSHG